MNKYLNKGLLYTWFNSAKAPIIIGILAWGVIAHMIIEEDLSGLSREISYSFSNDFHTTNLDHYIWLGVIFIAIYYIAQGINKRNTAMFLSSGPYTKKQIKHNELICILITLALFVLTYVYIAFMSYVKNKEFLAIVDGYSTIILIEISRIILIGIIGILFMLIMDLLFSNTVIGFISMFFVIPISICGVLVKLREMLEYSGVFYYYSLIGTSDNLNDEIRKNEIRIMLDNVSIKEITVKELSIEIAIALSIIIIMSFIFNAVQKRYKLESCNKIFSSKTNEKFITSLISIALGSWASLLLFSGFINRMQYKHEGYFLVGSDLIKGFMLDVLCIAIVGFVSYKIIKKLLKNVV